VIFPDPVVQPLREKRRLISADTLNETCHAKPPNHA
jgi:tRNA G46 methylase TrmB